MKALFNCKLTTDPKPKPTPAPNFPPDRIEETEIINL